MAEVMVGALLRALVFPVAGLSVGGYLVSVVLSALVVSVVCWWWENRGYRRW